MYGGVGINSDQELHCKRAKNTKRVEVLVLPPIQLEMGSTLDRAG